MSTPEINPAPEQPANAGCAAMAGYARTARKTTRANQMPIAECPHCETEFQWDDYYDLSAGDTHECPNCEKEIHVLSVDHIMSVNLGTQA